MAPETKLKCKLKSLDEVATLLRDTYWQSMTSYTVPLYSWYNKTAWVHGEGGLCWQEIRHHSATQTALFPSAAAAAAVVIEASYDFPAQTGNYFLFVNDDHFNLATSFCAVFVKGFPHSPLSMWGNYTILGPCLTCIKTRVVIALSEPYTHTQFINRCWEEIFFFLLLLCRRMLRLEGVG